MESGGKSDFSGRLRGSVRPINKENLTNLEAKLDMEYVYHWNGGEGGERFTTCVFINCNVCM